MKRIILTTVVALILSACGKNEHYTDFLGTDKVFFADHESSDSLMYSFANFPAANSKDLKIALKVMGAVSDRERSVSIVVDESATTALPSEYQLGEAVIPAGSPTGYVTLTIVNAPRLEFQDARLTLRLKDSESFSVEPEKPGKFNELVKFSVIWSNELIHPEEWPSQWGGYSKVKHRLVIDLTGYYTYSRYTFEPQYQVMGIANQWLEAYLAEHGEPYKDENGNEIRFCTSCF